MEKKKQASDKPGRERPEKIDFEKALKELEEIAVALEDGELSLDDSLKKFERGISLARYCRQRLEDAERKIEILQRGEDDVVRSRQVSVDTENGEIENDDDLQGSLL